MLRRVRPGDEHQVHDLLSDMRVVRYMLFPVFTLHQAERFVEAQQGPTPEGDPRQEVYGIATMDSGDLLGLCGLVFDPSGLTAEIWYALTPDSWGNGYATEASHQLVHQAFTRLGCTVSGRAACR